MWTTRRKISQIHSTEQLLDLPVIQCVATAYNRMARDTRQQTLKYIIKGSTRAELYQIR